MYGMKPGGAPKKPPGRKDAHGSWNMVAGKPWFLVWDNQSVELFSTKLFVMQL